MVTVARDSRNNGVVEGLNIVRDARDCTRLPRPDDRRNGGCDDYRTRYGKDGLSHRPNYPFTFYYALKRFL
jgi:hypothetical protein